MRATLRILKWQMKTLRLLSAVFQGFRILVRGSVRRNQASQTLMPAHYPPGIRATIRKAPIAKTPKSGMFCLDF